MTRSESCVAFKSRVHRGFPQQSYVWFDIRMYSLMNPECSNSGVLESLIQSQEYNDSYLSSEMGASIDGQRVHGPYDLNIVTTDSYDVISTHRAIEMVHEFVRTGQPPITVAELDLDALLLEPVSQADTVFLFREDPLARHDLGWILDEFTELIVVCRQARSALVVVMGSD